MQQQQQGGGSQYRVSQEEMTPFAAAADPQAHTQCGSATEKQIQLGDPSFVGFEAEAASPISSRPPAVALSSARNFEQFLSVTTSGEDPLGCGDDADRGGFTAGAGNRWPRQETLALLKIRSDMDAVFRDATIKGPLWEDVSRKLAELGYNRSSKKCKEKFENVHKYYKRTKEGRAGRQDGKSYRFFSQLEALHNTFSSSSSTIHCASMPPVVVTQSTMAVAGAAATHTSTTNNNIINSNPTAAAPAPPITVAVSNNPIPSSSVRFSNTILLPMMPPPPPPHAQGIIGGSPFPASSSDHFGAVAKQPLALSGSAAMGISFLSDTSSSSSSSDTDDEEVDGDRINDDGMTTEARDELECDEPVEDTSRRYKRKRDWLKHSRGSSSSRRRRMMEFFEDLMKQVMEKQESMQQKFLEAIEKREQDRMIREEAWKRQEMARLAREHDLMAHERYISASRDAAIIAFLQKITGQTIQLPPVFTNDIIIPAARQQVPPPPPTDIPPTPSPPPSTPSQLLSFQHQYHYKPQQGEVQQSQHYHPHHQPQPQPRPQQQQDSQSPISSSQVVARAVPDEQEVHPLEIGGIGSFGATSSRWPKAEVLALINLRSGLESRYQEGGPKGPLWEEISAGMQRMGYNRSAKRCKEKWENINKYFKKVKESNKKRPEDAKTCPYFYQLDALHRKKLLGDTVNTTTTTTTTTNNNSSSIVIGGGGSISIASANQNNIMTQHHEEESTVMNDLNMQERSSDFPFSLSSPQMVKITEPESQRGSDDPELQTRISMAASIFGEGSSSQGGAGGTTNKPEDIVKEVLQLQQNKGQHLQQQQQQHLMSNDYDEGIEEPGSANNFVPEEDDDEEDSGEDNEDETESRHDKRKMMYTIKYQGYDPGSSNGEGNGTPSLAMVR